MTFSKSLATAVVASGLAMAASTAHGATHNPGIYDATSVTTGHHDHSVWLVGFAGDGADRYWQFQDGSSVFHVDEDGATLNATIVHNTDDKNIMELSMEFSHMAGAGSAGPKCGGDCSDTSEWDYFDFVSATLTGVGSLAGTILDLEIYPLDQNGLPAMPGQLGWGANDKDAGFGFSSWFSWNERGTDRSGRGDVNMQLHQTPSEVPLPMPALMLLSGLGALGAARKFRKA